MRTAAALLKRLSEIIPLWQVSTPAAPMTQRIPRLPPLLHTLATMEVRTPNNLLHPQLPQAPKAALAGQRLQQPRLPTLGLTAPTTRSRPL